MTSSIPEPGTITPQETQRQNVRAIIIDTLETLLLALVLYFGINAISSRVRVQNVSMIPTLHEGEYLLINKLAYRFGSPQIGDIVIFHYPLNPQEDFIKRIIGRPGDHVSIHDGKVLVNNQELSEDYIADVPNYSGDWDVPADQIFVLGDNRNQSTDSHKWGYVPMGEVIGKALLIYWPFDQARLLSDAPVVDAAN
jgi:signal peptidase I